MKTLENNKLIAIFKGLIIEGDEVKNSLGWFSIDRLNYHSSWDSLMPVVEKIESLGYVIEIMLVGCFIKGDGFYHAFNDNTKIEATYQAVVEFINWHNGFNKDTPLIK